MERPQALRLDQRYLSVFITVALPVIVQHIVSIGLNLVDVLMIGRVGVDELAAVGAANRIYSLFGMLNFSMVSGASIYVAQYWGTRDIANIRRVLGLALVCCVGLSLVFLLLAAFLARPLLALFLHEADVIELARQYLHIAMFTYPLLAVSSCISVSSRAIRRLKAPTVINACALTLNTLLNYCLIFGGFGFPRLGVVGAAIATLIARLLETGLMLACTYGAAGHPLAARPRELFAFDRALSRSVFHTALPVLLSDGSMTLGNTCYFIAFGYLSTAAVGVMQIAGVLNDFFQSLFYGVGSAAAVIIGNELGRGEKEATYGHGKLMLRATVVLSFAVTLLMLLSRGLVVRAYDLEPAASAMLSGAIFVYACYMLPRMISYILQCGVLRAGGDTTYCMLAGAATVWLVSVPAAFCAVLLLHWSLPGVLALLMLGDVLAALLLLRRFHSRIWLNTLI